VASPGIRRPATARDFASAFQAKQPPLVECRFARRAALAIRFRSESERCVDWDHRGAAGVNSFDDLAVVDALQVDRSDAEVAVAELALDDDQRHAFASELDGMRVPELVRREAPTDAGREGGPAPLMTQNSGPTGSSTRSSSHGRSSSQAHSSMPTSRRRPPLPLRMSNAPRR
jgi:hypothetical protein